VRVIVIGGGIVGLAVARELLQRVSGTAVTLLEKEAVVGHHQNSHNSGVLHAGLY
jgi:L-2-hydroxyglutarate oxidase LhgO